MKTWVLNSGSSSIKYQLFDMKSRSVLASGLLEEIGRSDGRLVQKIRAGDGGFAESELTGLRVNHREGIEKILESLATAGVMHDASELFGIGHRVAHGGDEFREPALIDDQVIAAIRRQIPLSPLHNPVHLMGIEIMLAVCPDVSQVAVFDTAFHHTIPPHAYHYALPRELYEDHHVRRYAFHGTSHHYVAKRAAEHLEQPLESLNLIVFHLGSGASVTAIRQGKSVDSSMGMTPLEGLIMGTRCGDLDPGLVFYLSKVTGKSNDELETMLYKQSGLAGVSGVSDMRDVQQMAADGDPWAKLALDMYAYRVKKYIGAYYAALGRVDAIIFTAGVGENSPEVRARSCVGLEQLGIVMDWDKNETKDVGTFEIQADSSPVKILVVPTNEELEIAEQTVACIQAAR